LENVVSCETWKIILGVFIIMIEKRKPAIRQRPIQVKFFVDEKELSLIKVRMAQLGIENMSAYLRQVAIDGYEEKPDMPERREPQNP